jgi:hypothetical protein
MKLSRMSKVNQQRLVALLAFVFTLLIRLPMVGGPPYTDECMYALRSMLANQGTKATEYSPIDLYPTIAGALAGVPEKTPLLHLRIFDAFVAAAAAAAVGLFLWRWSAFWPALAMTIGWSLAANHPEYVQCGFRNSIMAATFVFVVALNMLSIGARWLTFVAGLLIPLVPLLREQFFLVVIASIFLAAALGGRKGFLDHLAGLIVGGMLQLAWIVPSRGSPMTILGFYRDRGMALNQSEFTPGFDPWSEVRISLETFLNDSSWFLIPAILGLIALVPARVPPNRRFWSMIGLTLLLPLSHLYEVFGMTSKKVIYYHWAQFLFVAAFLGAVGLHQTALLARAKRVPWVSPRMYVGLAVILLLLGFRQTVRDYRQAWRLSKHFAPVMVWGKWDHPVVQESYYLTLAQALRHNARAADRLLVSGGYCVPAYALASLYPTNPELIDLARFQQMKYFDRRPELVELMRKSPADLFVEELGQEYLVEHDSRQAWPDFSERFELIETIPPDGTKLYGWVGARIYRLRK